VATSTLTGTTGNELLAAGGVATTLVQGGAGNDSITLALALDEADGGAGNDSITLAAVNGPQNTITAGTGNDTIFVNTQAASIGGNLGLNEGNDTFSNTSVQMVNASLGGNAGNDTIQLGAGSTNLTLGGGANVDSILVSAGTYSSSKFTGGGGADTLNINGATFSLSTVQASDGHDHIYASGAVLTNAIVAGGKGYDSITIGTSVTTSSIAGGALADTINVISAFGGGIIYGDGLGVTTGGSTNGADLIGSTQAQFGLVATTVYGGGGNDTIRFNSAGGAAAAYIFGGDGNDVIGNTAAAWSHSASTLSGGEGNDIIKMVAMQTQGQLILGGAGADTINIINNTGNGSINGGAGADSIVIGNTAATAGTAGGSDLGTTTGLFTINGGDGADTINFELGFSSTTATVSVSLHTAATGIHSVTSLIGIVAYGAGDNIRLTNTSIEACTAQWVGAGGQVVVASTMTAMDDRVAVAGTDDGQLGVYSDGTDTFFWVVVSATQSRSLAFVVTGADLVTTTAVGLVNNTTANLGFTLGAATGTAGGTTASGISITLI